MKKVIKPTMIFCLIIIALTLSTGLYLNLENNQKKKTLSIEQQKYLVASNPVVGIYNSISNHKIIKNADNTYTYDNLYNLTYKANAKGSTLTGKIGSNNKSITLYQINQTTFAVKSEINYLENNETMYLYAQTIFKTTKEITPSETGIAELWRDNKKINTYETIQDAIDMAESNDTVKINSDYTATEGIYINKNIILDGDNHTINKSNIQNTFLIVEENTNVTIKNLIIDGGASGFIIDYDAITYTDYAIPIKTGTDATDPKQTMSAVVSKGNLTANNIELKNNYVNGHGGALQIISGKATFTNSKFNHNRGNNGGAIYIYARFKDGQTIYPIESVYFDNCDFTNNYSSSAGAIYAANINSVTINNSRFINNVANKGYGGAISLARNTLVADGVQYNSQGHYLGLDYIQASITGCIFESNYAGKDGSAIINAEGELVVSNTIFRKNVGVNKDASVGTVACHVFRHNMWGDQIFNNCTFEENFGQISCFADYGSKVFVKFYGTAFKENEGDSTLSYITAYTEIDNCNFIEDKSTEAVVDISISSESSYYEDCDKKEPTIEIKNTNIKDAITKEGILITSHTSKEIPKAKVTFSGTTSANINVSNDNNVTIKGIHQGQVTVDSKSSKETIVVEKTAALVGEIVKNNVTINYTDENNSLTKKEVYIEPGTAVTKEYMRELLKVTKTDQILEFYTDENNQTIWDYKIANNLVLYARWVGHVHTKQNELKSINEGIYYSCECGYLYEGISLKMPSNLLEDGTEKQVTITNTLNIPTDNYQIIYKKKINNNWQTITEIPTTEGEYKAELIYAGKTAQLKYKVYASIKNPPTGSSNIIPSILVLLTLVVIMFTISKKFSN